MEGLSEADDQWAPQINLGVPVLIPEDYVPDLDVRLGLAALSGLTTKVDQLGGEAFELHLGREPRQAAVEAQAHVEVGHVVGGDQHRHAEVDLRRPGLVGLGEPFELAA